MRIIQKKMCLCKCLQTAEASPILREHSEGHPAQTRLLCRGLLRHGVPLLPTREYSHQHTSPATQRGRATCQNRWSICFHALSALSRQYICAHTPHSHQFWVFWRDSLVQRPTWSVFHLLSHSLAGNKLWIIAAVPCVGYRVYPE